MTRSCRISTVVLRWPFLLRAPVPAPSSLRRIMYGLVAEDARYVIRVRRVAAQEPMVAERP